MVKKTNYHRETHFSLRFEQRTIRNWSYLRHDCSTLSPISIFLKEHGSKITKTEEIGKTRKSECKKQNVTRCRLIWSIKQTRLNSLLMKKKLKNVINYKKKNKKLKSRSLVSTYWITNQIRLAELPSRIFCFVWLAALIQLYSFKNYCNYISLQLGIVAFYTKILPIAFSHERIWRFRHFDRFVPRTQLTPLNFPKLTHFL
jgi:hypothetical protein